ncbi:MAG: hypothetical protein EXR16_03150 [Bacteroidetes bacterium]|nr:hypothetical protein [Bacteroidota bacterium]
MRGVKGSAFMSEDKTFSQVKAQALNDAKSNALKKAGIPESIKSNELLFTSQQNNDFSHPRRI